MTDAELIAMARAARVDDRSDGALYGRLADRIGELILERDEARAYGTEVRLREKAAEDARVSAVDRAAKAEAERDAARALLRGLRDWLADEKLNTWPYMEGPGFYDDKETWVHCLNTSL
jgi:hypothetical protein